MCSLGIKPTTFCAANTMLYHWATGTYSRPSKIQSWQWKKRTTVLHYMKLSLIPFSHIAIQNQHHRRRFTQTSLFCHNGAASGARSHSRDQMAHKAEKRATSIALAVITMCFYWPWHFKGIGNTCLLTFRVWIMWDISCLRRSPFMNRSVQRVSPRAHSKYSHAVKNECDCL